MKCYTIFLYITLIHTLNELLVESTITWSKIEDSDSKSPLKGIRNFSSVAVSYDWFFFGGIADLKYLNSLFKYDYNSNGWTEVPCGGEIPLPRAGATLTLLDNSLILFGGENYDGTFSDVFSLDLNTYSWRKLHTNYKIESRSGHAATTDERNIYIFGGYNENGSLLNDLWQLNIEDNTAYFKLIGDGTVPETENSTLTYVMGNLYLIGGYRNNSNKVWEFTDKWQPITPWLPINLPESHTSIRVGDSILVLGGLYNSYSLISHNNQIWAFSKSNNSWTILPIYNDNKHPISAAILHDTIVIVDEDYFLYKLDNLPLCGFGASICSGKGYCNDKICSCEPGNYGHDCGISAKLSGYAESNAPGTPTSWFSAIADILKAISRRFMFSCVIITFAYIAFKSKRRRDRNMDTIF